MNKIAAVISIATSKVFRNIFEICLQIFLEPPPFIYLPFMVIGQIDIFSIVAAQLVFGGAKSQGSGYGEILHVG